MTTITIKKEVPGILPCKIASLRPMVKTMVILSNVCCKIKMVAKNTSSFMDFCWHISLDPH
jgi:hypothetical protein